MEKRYWSPQQDEKLIECIWKRMSSAQTAAIIGVSKDSAKKRAKRLGVKFERWREPAKNIGTEGHIPADERSGELLRAAGVKI